MKKMKISPKNINEMTTEEVAKLEDMKKGLRASMARIKAIEEKINDLKKKYDNGR